MSEVIVKKIKRSAFASFLNVGSKTSPTWKRMGKGITEQTIAYNPNTTSETYIDEDSARTSVDGYAVSVPTPQTAYAGEPVFEYVDGLRKNRAVGADCETQIMFVYIYSEESTGKYSAEVNDCTISVEEFGGEGGGNVALSYTINVNGDPQLGTCQITAGVPTFTAK